MTTTRIQRSRRHNYNPAQEAGQAVIYCGRPSLFGNPFISNDRGEGALYLKDRDDLAGTIVVEMRATTPMPAEVAVRLFDDWIMGTASLDHLWHNWCGQLVSSTVAHVAKVARQRMLTRIPALRGRTLSCWCALDAPCHVDTLIRLCDDPEAFKRALEA